ncbi:hypothetical protein L1049_028216 [Liquidambar formosana]|uniref:Uncharacterized protein n=1 Tax=Liquidambar formosana TaxID=63359 RepID=A0AAP0RJX5_LIQFO
MACNSLPCLSCGWNVFSFLPWPRQGGLYFLLWTCIGLALHCIGLALGLGLGSRIAWLAIPCLSLAVVGPSSLSLAKANTLGLGLGLGLGFGLVLDSGLPLKKGNAMQGDGRGVGPTDRNLEGFWANRFDRDLRGRDESERRRAESQRIVAARPLCNLQYPVCSHSNPSQKIRVGRRCNPRGDPANQLLCALRVYWSVDSHTCQIPWSVFQDGPNEEPTGRRQERVARAWVAAAIRVGPRPESIGGPSRRHSTFDQDASPALIRFPPDNFKHSLTLFPKSFSSFLRGTCLLSVSRQYLALDGIYRPIGAAFPNNPTHRQRLVVRQGPGTMGLSPSSAPPSRGFGPGPPLRTLLQTTIRATGPPDSQAGLFLVRSPLLRESL